MEDEAGMWAMVEGTPRGDIPKWDVIDTMSQRDDLLGNAKEGRGGGERRGVEDVGKYASAGFVDGQAQGAADGMEGDMWDAVEDERFRGLGLEDGMAVGGRGDFFAGGEAVPKHRKSVRGSDHIASRLEPHQDPSKIDRGRDSRASGVTSRFSWAVNSEEEMARDPRLLEEISRCDLMAWMACLGWVIS